MLSDNYYQKQLEQAWPKEPALKLSPEQIENYRQQIKQLLQEKNAVLVAHFYTDAEIQKLAEETGGFVGDSLQMAKFGANHSAETIIVAGVKFMGETAKILNPEKTVLMPDLGATCSLDLGCDAADLQEFIQQHPGREVVVYINTSAAVKACADWVVTSSIALKVVDYLAEQDKKIIWAPDKYLGDYIQKQTGADMILWHASCVVHEEFQATELTKFKQQYPDATVLVHPESPASVIAQADVVGSTSQLLKASQELPNKTFIVATENGIFYKMRQASPAKEFIEAPSMGPNASCRCCAKCPWMKMNNLQNLAAALENGAPEITIDEQIRVKALKPLQRMLEFA